MNKIVLDLTYTKQAFEVDPRSRMQNTLKPGGLTAIVLAVWICAAVEARAQFQCSVGTTPPKILQNTSQGLIKERQTSRTSIAVIRGHR